ncbi:MAG: choice-of-anchor R domain-containing protein, partial [Limisphaerales bacterium]
VSSRFVGNAGDVNFFPSNNITLPPGIYYVVAAPTTPANSGFVNWAYATDPNWTGSGILGGFADTSSGAWANSSITNLPQQLSVQATPVSAAVGIGRQGDVTTLSWPSMLNGYVLESATNLASPVWLPITNAPTTVAGNNTLTNNGSDPARFFRLRQSLVADNLEQPTAGWVGPIGTDANTNDFLIGQEFTLPAGNYNLNKVTLLLNPIYGDGSVTVSLWHVGPDNNPTNEISIVASQSVAKEEAVDFVPSALITLPSGSYYVVVAPTTSADNALVGWDWTFSTAWTGFGTLGGFADTYPGTWENFPIGNGPYQMSVQAKLTSP